MLGLVVWLGWLQKRLALEESVGYTIRAAGFGIYLWHSLALAPAVFFICKALGAGTQVPLVWALALVLQFALAIGIGYLTTRTIEFPFLRLREALLPSRRREASDHAPSPPNGWRPERGLTGTA